MIKEIRLHGRGGQGVVIASEILTSSFVVEGRSASGFPMFGFERRGAPVTSFVRFGDEVVREKTQIYTPDCIVILDAIQLRSPAVFGGLKPNSILVLNSPRQLDAKPHDNVEICGVVDATRIAFEEIGIPATNSCMLGAFAATTEWISLDSILSALNQYFKDDILDKNLRSCRRGYSETRVNQW